LHGKNLLTEKEYFDEKINDRLKGISSMALHEVIIEWNKRDYSNITIKE